MIGKVASQRGCHIDEKDSDLGVLICVNYTGKVLFEEPNLALNLLAIYRCWLEQISFWAVNSLEIWEGYKHWCVISLVLKFGIIRLRLADQTWLLNYDSVEDYPVE